MSEILNNIPEIDEDTSQKVDQDTLETTCKYTSSSDDIKEVIDGDIVYCLVPRICREAFAITLPNEIIDDELPNTREEQLTDKIKQTLEENMKNMSIFVLSLDKINETSENASYNIIFLRVFKALINQLFLADKKTINFYVGYSENGNEYPLLTGPPADRLIAKSNKENINLPYHATLHLS